MYVYIHKMYVNIYTCHVYSTQIDRQIDRYIVRQIDRQIDRYRNNHQLCCSNSSGTYKQMKV